jgi:hypothetical protein
MGAKRLKQEHPAEYINRVRDTFPDVPGNADYCVYWFNKAHKLMPPGARAGLVGTNTIRQNYSREGGLDIITATDGHIFEAVSSMPWSGEAKVHVSIACWERTLTPRSPLPQGEDTPPQPASAEDVGTRFIVSARQTPRLWLDGDQYVDIPFINSSLSPKTDVSGAAVLACNREPRRVFSGQQTGHIKFVLSPEEIQSILKRDSASQKVIYPFIIGRDLLAQPGGQPSRYVIDVNDLELLDVQAFPVVYKHLKTHILPAIEKKAESERERNRQLLKAEMQSALEHEFAGNLERWWKHVRGRSEDIGEISKLNRYIACSRVTKRPIFDFVHPQIHPETTISAFIFEDDYSFGILQSNAHWQWFTEKASTLTERFRYTPHSVFDTFPWPQSPTHAQVKAVAVAGRALHEYRREAMANNPHLTLRDLYRTLELPGKNPLKDLHAALDKAVLAAYGFDAKGDILGQLLDLNQQVAGRIEAGEAVTAPGIPADYPNPAELVSAGCITPPELV